MKNKMKKPKDPGPPPAKPTAKRIKSKTESLFFKNIEDDYEPILLKDISEIAGVPLDQIGIKIFLGDTEWTPYVEFYKVTQEEVENANFDAELIAYNEKFEAWSKKKQDYDVAMKAWVERKEKQDRELLEKKVKEARQLIELYEKQIKKLSLNQRVNLRFSSCAQRPPPWYCVL